MQLGQMMIVLLAFASVSCGQVMVEKHTDSGAAGTFDHAVFDGLLAKYVDESGWVDYGGLLTQADTLDGYITALGAANFDQLGRDEKLAFLINSYNAFTLRLILDYWDDGKLESIKDIPASKRWKHARWQMAGHTVSLDAIEHEWVRKHFAEPRIHYALVCAAYSCPKLRNQAYVGSKLEQQLTDQTQYTLAGARWLHYDQTRNTLRLTKLLSWYGSDFEVVDGDILIHIKQHVAPVQQTLARGERPRIEWLDYSWKLNDRRNQSLISDR